MFVNRDLPPKLPGTGLGRRQSEPSCPDGQEFFKCGLLGIGSFEGCCPENPCGLLGSECPGKDTESIDRPAGQNTKPPTISSNRTAPGSTATSPANGSPPGSTTSTGEEAPNPDPTAGAGDGTTSTGPSTGAQIPTLRPSPSPPPSPSTAMPTTAPPSPSPSPDPLPSPPPPPPPAQPADTLVTMPGTGPTPVTPGQGQEAALPDSSVLSAAAQNVGDNDGGLVLPVPIIIAVSGGSFLGLVVIAYLLYLKRRRRIRRWQARAEALRARGFDKFAVDAVSSEMPQARAGPGRFRDAGDPLSQ